MESYIYEYRPTVRDMNIAIMEFMFEEMQKSDAHAKAVYYTLSDMLNNANLEEQFKEWHKRKLDYAIKNIIKH